MLRLLVSTLLTSFVQSLCTLDPVRITCRWQTIAIPDFKSDLRMASLFRTRALVAVYLSRFIWWQVA